MNEVEIILCDIKQKPDKIDNKADEGSNIKVEKK